MRYTRAEDRESAAWVWENAQRGAQVHGGSAVTNRALELLGNHLGLFKEPEQKLPVNLEDLPDEVLQRMLVQAEAAAAELPKDAPAPPKVN